MMCAQAIPKINLFLDVLGKREDGYHDIRTIFLPLISPADHLRITVSASDSLDIVCAAAGVPEGPENLCWRAAEAFAAETGQRAVWRIDIEKEIPTAAGLGGGSSDAAAVLGALNRHLGRDRLSAEVLHRIAARLGADVPFFLLGVPAIGEGIGESLRPISCKLHAGVILVCAGFPVSAAWAYAHHADVRRPPAPDADRLLEALASGELAAVSRHTYNALEFALLNKLQFLGLVCGRLLDAGCLCAHVSGSGPSVYGLCRPEEARRIAATVRHDLGTAARVFATEPVRGCGRPGGA